ncbi:Pimeloyl-ACP methyl ester carboxylesterase [Streptoalloteichus tenebrarius]|uniref:Pimeloyl-ACP methyl ester carboxylesterase n=1 Tax=Streptoalloteichus tenebrarius (strain ATCC 17920 / DSM 40477 / JCM 4838 / CBS 697.72 / NBRC 16177 / NCIMB 11028 / NRRL B-12390 / A12253. 1 / ISP 5477) TaxID=1933 RepID=A0ABT1HTM2_STRSD|nr:alpha/beta hydrolase [Streptoalloteichus tenebrarius]MCP2258859.1 Pimeloyl-ACP methyl ester carboxylesterase [Streptoalloteichus tenebrarius]BFE99457.1 alpha/beta hydrolase [Streptoalloteichus tenebrarius]
MSTGDRAGGHGDHSFGVSSFVTTEDGRRLHFMARGTGDPTVVFESGMGFSRSTWGLVQPVVGRRVRAVVYDRAGIGRSDADPRPRTLDRMAGDLGTLLRALGPGPFVLVGHSWGGPVVRVAAAADPSRIRGLVLVDPSDENCDLYFTPSARRGRACSRLVLPVLARLGLYRLLGGGAGRAQPADVVADHRREDFTVRAARALLAELAPFADELRRLRRQRPELGDIEVSVITGARSSRFGRTLRTAISEAHRRTAAALPNGRLVEARRSGHLVLFSEPEVIVGEILRMVDADPQEPRRE